jgi:hypothetical protein
MSDNPLDKKMIAFLIDMSALKDMFEGKQSGDKLVEKLNEMKYAGRDVKAVTPLASFLRAIYLCNPEVKINAIQKVLNFLDVVPSQADFKNEEAVRDEIIKFASMLGKKAS